MHSSFVICEWANYAHIFESNARNKTMMREKKRIAKIKLECLCDKTSSFVDMWLVEMLGRNTLQLNRSLITALKICCVCNENERKMSSEKWQPAIVKQRAMRQFWMYIYCVALTHHKLKRTEPESPIFFSYCKMRQIQIALATASEQLLLLPLNLVMAKLWLMCSRFINATVWMFHRKEWNYHHKL